MKVFISCFSMGFALSIACATQAALPRDKFLNGNGKLTTEDSFAEIAQFLRSTLKMVKDK